jgi:NADP-dependent 3-hydroxy acid dehydrogenase YdfG
VNGLHAVITGGGGGSGIGAAIATRLAHEGVQVTSMGRSLDRLRSLRLADGQCGVADVSDPASAQPAFGTAAAFAPIDILVNNAGEVESVPFMRTSRALCRRESAAINGQAIAVAGGEAM